MKKLTERMAETLERLHTGMIDKKPHAATVDGLQHRGFITVRDIDGEIRVTTTGLDWLYKHRSKMKKFNKMISEIPSVKIHVSEHPNGRGFFAKAVDHNTEEQASEEFNSIDAIYRHAKLKGFSGDIEIFVLQHTEDE